MDPVSTILIIPSALPAAHFAISGALPSMDGFFSELTTWLLRVITVGGGFFLLIDMAKHLFTSPRDLRAAGIDLAVFVILLALAGQAQNIATNAAALIK